MAFIKNISTSFTDADLVQQYKQAKNMEVLGELYQRYMDLVYGVCLKYLNNTDDAKDAVLNIFEELTVKVKKYEIDHFKGWLYQLAKNHCLMKIRKQKCDPIYIDTAIVHLAENEHLEDTMEKERQFEKLEICIEQLPLEQKAAVKLFYLNEKCYKEIAETTVTDINKVRSFIQNGRRNLKICMETNALQKVE